MAIAFVRSISAVGNGVVSVTPVLSSVAAGNKLVLAGSLWGDYGNNIHPTGVTSSPAATWRNDVNGPMAFTGPNAGNQTYLWSADAATSGTTSATVTFVGVSYPQVVLAEYSGLAAGAASFDRSSGNEGGLSTAQSNFSNPSVVGPTAATTAADELVIAVFGASAGVEPSTLNIGTPTGYTNRFRDNDGFTYCALSVDDRVVSATGTQSASWSHDTDEWGVWSGLIATYKAATGVATALAVQAKAVPAPAQVATVSAVASARSGSTSLTIDSSTVRIDSSAPTVDATGLSVIPAPTQIATAVLPGSLSPTTITWDSESVTWDSESVTFDGGVIPQTSTAVAAHAIAQPGTTATATAVSRATAAQTPAGPAQVASVQASFGVVTSQLLLPPTQVATGTRRAAAVHNWPATMPGQTATATVQATASAVQGLLLPAQQQAASTTLLRVAHQALTLARPDQTATARAIRPVHVVELEPEYVPPPIGGLDDMVSRLVAVLPPWFGTPGVVPAVLRIPLAMAGQLGSWLHDLIAYARKQTRIKTATGGWLDLIAWDFFGDRIRRRPGQSDESFRQRILVEMFRPRATRPAMAAVLRDLTGMEPRIFEPNRPADVGGIGIPSGLAIGVSGAIGTLGLPGEVFIDVYRNPDAGIPMAAGIGVPVGGIGVPSRLVITSLEDVVGTLRDEDIYAAVEATRPVGILTWVRISLGVRPAV